MNELNKICRATGADQFHTVKVFTDEETFVWDGSTAATATINADVARVREKVRFDAVAFKAYDSQPNVYHGTIRCLET